MYCEVLFSNFDCDMIDKRGLHLHVRGLYEHELILSLARSSSAKFITVRSSGSAIS